jgi:hypothetical protein
MSVPIPFASASDAWFWTVRALRLRREGGGRRDAVTVRPCDPDDVIRAVDCLWRQDRLDPRHLVVLRTWGERGTTPPDGDGRVLWDEAMVSMEAELRRKGIVA